MKSLFFSLIIISGFCFASCEKEPFPSKPKRDQGSTRTKGSVFKGDDDELLIEGIVLNAVNAPIPDADVSLFESGQTTGLDTSQTDVNGSFSMEVDSGSYFFEVYENSLLLITTGDYSVNSDTTITIRVP